MSVATLALSSLPDGLGDKIAAVQARIAALTGTTAPSSGLPGASDPSTNSTTFAGTLAQAQTQLDGSADGSTASSGAGVSGDDIVADATQYLGVPYKWGGTDPATGLDCSGFVQRVLADKGISAPRTAAQQATMGTEVDSLADAQPGDLVVLEGGHHIGIYVGDGEIINAPKTGDVVKVEKVWETPTTIRRVTGPTGTDTGTDTGSGGVSTASLLASLLGSSSAPAGVSTSSSSALSAYLRASLLGGSTGSTSSSAYSAYAASPGPTGATSGVAQYQSLFTSAEQQYGLPAGLLSAVATVESGGDAGAVSSAGAQGLMQLMPGTAAGLGVDATDPAQAVDGAARLLRSNLSRFGSLPLALAAYNAGPGNVTKYGGVPPFSETQHYVSKVTALMPQTTSYTGSL